MLNRLSCITFLTVIIPKLILLSPCILVKDVFARPLEDNFKTLEKTSKPTQIKVNSSNELVLEDHHLTTEKEIGNKKVKLKETEFQSFCSTLSHLTNKINSNISYNSEQNRETPTSYCAEDLKGVVNFENKEKKSYEPSLILQENFYKFAQEQPKNQSVETINNNQWHFKLQPYVTVPINTYGTVSARGRTVSYHLTLGELLDTLRVTASGRFEGWNGRWGFIIDGYFASLQDIGNLSIRRSRTPNPINALNFLLNRGVNTKLEEVVNVFDRSIQVAENIEQIRNNNDLQNLKDNVEELRNITVQKEQGFQELDLRLEEFENALIRDGQNIEILDINFEDIQNINLKIERLQALDINNERLRQILSLESLDLPKIDDLQDLNEKIRRLEQLSDLKTVVEQLRQTRENLQQLSQQVKELKEQEVIEQLQDLNEKISRLNQLSALKPVVEQLRDTKETLEQLREQVKTLKERDVIDKDKLQNLEEKIEQAKAFLDREIETVEKIENFEPLRDIRQFNRDTRASLQFEQGIYDFAISYHIGDLPSHELPNKPSNRPFPLFWFQPIAGVRLNDISIDIETITTTTISSSLVNVESTVQRNFRSDRTWFEPLFGGKFGMQISDPITFWLRGDASGFGIAGETNISWNFLFGVDWWIHRQISLQLGYRFYEIDYKNNDNNEFGFEENINGPFLSATFHF